MEGGSVVCPVAGESLNRPDESKLSSVRFLLSPLVWLRQPAPISSACHGADWPRKSCTMVCGIWQSYPPNAFTLEGKVWQAISEPDEGFPLNVPHSSPSLISSKRR